MLRVACVRRPGRAGSRFRTFCASSQWIPFELERSQEYTHDTKVLNLSVQPSKLAQLQLGGLGVGPAFHFTVRVELDDGTFATRPYTPVNYDALAGSVELLVKRYEGGIVSSHLHDMVPGNSILELQGPFQGQFSYDKNKINNGGLALFGAGTGVTPIVQLARAALGNRKNDSCTIVYLLNKSKADILCKTEMDSLAALYDESRLRVHYVIETPGEAPVGGWQGRISSEVLQETELPLPSTDNLAVICGPPSFNEVVTKLLQAYGYGSEQITVC